MPNPGKQYWTKNAREAIQRAHDNGQKIGINIAGDSPLEISDMVLWAIERGFDWTTINGGCPNKYDNTGKPKGTLTFDDLDVESLVRLLDGRAYGSTCEVWWKPSPFTDTVTALPRSARIIGDSKVITGYIANNTVPHCFAWNDEGEQAISFGNGRAGMGGPAVKPITAGHLAIIDDILPRRMARIASGGAIYGRDVLDHLRSKADLVQITSLLWVNNMNYGCVNHLLADLMLQPKLEEVLARHRS